MVDWIVKNNNKMNLTVNFGDHLETLKWAFFDYYFYQDNQPVFKDDQWSEKKFIGDYCLEYLENGIFKENNVNLIFLGENREYCYASDKMLITFMFARKRTKFNYSCFTIDNALLDLFLNEMNKICVPYLDDDDRKKSVFLLKTVNNSVDYCPIGIGYSEFIEENYCEEIIKARNEIIEEFNSDDPLGSLLILEGEPGCGKTYFIRSLISQIEDSCFVYIPSSSFESLLSPNLIDPLSELNKKFGKIFFILEDADKIICERQDTHMDTVNMILNITDGIMNKLFNIKIIASTNAEKGSVDNAILRSGRLMDYIKFDRLTVDNAEKLFNKLVNDDNPPKYIGSTLLADIYKEARRYNKGKREFLTKNEGKKEIGFKVS